MTYIGKFGFNSEILVAKKRTVVYIGSTLF